MVVNSFLKITKEVSKPKSSMFHQAAEVVEGIVFISFVDVDTGYKNRERSRQVCTGILTMLRTRHNPTRNMPAAELHFTPEGYCGVTTQFALTLWLRWSYDVSSEVFLTSGSSPAASPQRLMKTPLGIIDVWTEISCFYRCYLLRLTITPHILLKLMNEVSCTHITTVQFKHHLDCCLQLCSYICDAH